MKIWFDTEFIEGGREIYLLSIGLVRQDERTYYAEPSDTPRNLAGDWIRKNVFPHLNGPTKKRATIKDDLVAFCGYEPEFWANYGAYDWVLMCQIFGGMLEVPDHWPNFVMDIQQLRAECGGVVLPRQSTVEHHALNDAIWTRDAWKYLTKLRFAAHKSRVGILQ